MFKKMIQRKRQEKYERTIGKVPALSDKELFEWFYYADYDDVKRDLVIAIEKELSKRGYEHRRDY